MPFVVENVCPHLLHRYRRRFPAVVRSRQGALDPASVRSGARLPVRATAPQAEAFFIVWDPAALGAPPLASHAGVRRMGCSDVCLLNDEGYRAIEESSRPLLINLTVSMISLPDGVTCDTGGCR